MNQEKPKISKAVETDIGDVWFSKDEIKRMTGDTKKTKGQSSAIIKKKVSKTAKKASRTAKKHALKAKVLSKNPKFRQNISRLTSNKKFFFAGSSLVLAILVVGVWSQVASNEVVKTEILGEQVVVDPEFKVVLPEGSVSEPIYEPDKQVYRYAADYDGARLAVTQQPVPPDLLNGSLNLQQLALTIPDFESMARYESDSNGLVYIVSQTGNKQATVFIYNNELLVFLNADSRLGAEQVLGFVNQL